MQIENNLFKRQIEKPTTLPAPQNGLANYLLKDSYIFDVVGAKELVAERDIEKQLVEHVTKYLLEMGNSFTFVTKQKHFQIVPIKYELKSSVPPTTYIDQLMTYLNREYYIGLLNAAAFYGASHQQSQELTIITNKGNYRDKHKK